MKSNYERLLQFGDGIKDHENFFFRSMGISSFALPDSTFCPGILEDITCAW
jgi:hypothetical protein